MHLKSYLQHPFLGQRSNMLSKKNDRVQVFFFTLFCISALTLWKFVCLSSAAPCLPWLCEIIIKQWYIYIWHCLLSYQTDNWVCVLCSIHSNWFICSFTFIILISFSVQSFQWLANIQNIYYFLYVSFFLLLYIYL